MRSSHLSMFREFIRDPFSIGTICPSGSSLCKSIASNKELHSANVVVEIGAGTGCISEHVQQTIKQDATFISIEKNPHLYHILVQKYSNTTFILDGAENLPNILRQSSISKADVIISSLPWASFTPKQQTKLMRAIRASLQPTGVFITYAYVCGAVLPSFSSFRKRLGKSFGTVSTSKTIWNNIPPAFLYHCRQPVPVMAEQKRLSPHSSYTC